MSLLSLPQAFFDVEKESIESLEESFFFLTPAQKSVYIYVKSKIKFFERAFPSIKTIARCNDICEKTVTSALKLLRKMGWIFWIKRGYTSNVYYMPEILKNNDIEKSCVGPKKLPSNYHVLHTPLSEEIKKHVQPAANVSRNPFSFRWKSWDEWTKAIPFYVKPFQGLLKNFDFANYGWIFLKLSEKYFHEAINDCLAYVKYLKNLGKSVLDSQKLFVSYAIKLYNKQKQEKIKNGNHLGT